MPFGDERALVSSSPISAFYYRLYGAARVGDKIRAWHVLPHICANLRPGSSVLDAGCGMGHYSVHVARRFPEVKVQAVDVVDKHLAHLLAMADKLDLGNLGVRQCDLTELDSERQFDIVLCIDVLEHIEADREAVAYIARTLEVGGILVVHVPQRYQRHYLPQPEDLHTWEHVREGYSLAELSQLLNGVGLRTISHRNTFGFLGTLAWDLDEYFRQVKPIWIVLMPLILLLARLDTLRPNARGNGLLLVAQKVA